MSILTPTEGGILLAVFGAAMIFLVWLKSRGESGIEGFLVADRNLPLWHGSLSIAVSWIWAPAIFICSLQSFTKGLPGIFWFTFPNILCFFIFAPLAVRLRSLVPNAYTLPQFLFKRFGEDRRTHFAFLIVFFIYQFGATVINALAGGTLLHAVSGIDVNVAIIAMSAVSLTYSLMTGLKASVFTDIIQMLMILVIGLFLVPWAIQEAGGLQTIKLGIGGVDGTHDSLFDPWIAFTMGIPMSLGLIAGPISDQQFFQRTFAVKREVIAKTFVYGGLLFGIVPIVLSLLGFVGAYLVSQGSLIVDDPQVVGALVVGTLLPKWALYAFCFMAFAGLCSTMDSSYCAGSSLAAVDVYKRYLKPEASESQVLSFSRKFMVLMAVVGTIIALLKPKLLWVFLIYGAVSSAGMFPAIFALYWSKVTARGVFWAVMTSLILAFPLSIYANVIEDPYLIVAAAVISPGIGLIVCLISGLLNSEEKFDFSSLSDDQIMK